MSRSHYSAAIVNIGEKRKAYDLLFESQGSRLSDVNRLRELAMRAMARELLGFAVSAYMRGSVQEEPMAEYVALAKQLYPNVKDLPEGRALERRARFGPRWSRLVPGFLAYEAVRDVRSRLAWQRHRWSGV